MKNQTVELADKTSDVILRNHSANRAQLEEAYLAAQLDASAGVFQKVVGDRNTNSPGLNDAVSMLNDGWAHPALQFKPQFVEQCVEFHQKH